MRGRIGAPARSTSGPHRSTRRTRAIRSRRNVRRRWFSIGSIVRRPPARLWSSPERS